MSILGAKPGSYGVYGSTERPSVVLSNPSEGAGTVRIFEPTQDDDAFAGPPPPGVVSINALDVSIDSVAGSGSNVFTPAHQFVRFFDDLSSLFIAFGMLAASPDNNVIGQEWIARSADGIGVTRYLIDRPGGAGPMRLGQLVSAASTSVIEHNDVSGESFSIPATTGVTLGATGFFDGMSQIFVFPNVVPIVLTYADGVLSNFAPGRWKFEITITTQLPLEELGWSLFLQRKPAAGAFADEVELIRRETEEVEDDVIWSSTGFHNQLIVGGDEYRLQLKHNDGSAKTAEFFRLEWNTMAFGVST